MARVDNFLFQVLTLVIKCLSFMVSRPLSQLDSTIVGKISRHIFTLLRRYARAGAATADRNQELVQACFKVTMSKSFERQLESVPLFSRQ